MRKVELFVTVAIVVSFVIAVAAIARSAPNGSTKKRPSAAEYPEVRTDPSDPNRGSIMFGASGQYKWEIREREKELGKRMEAVRVYKRWDESLFGEDQIWARNTGHTIFLSIKTRRDDGSKIKWRDIANAEPGSRLYNDMVRQAREIQDFGASVYVIFNHEPDAKTSRPMGRPADFVAAWRKLVNTYRRASVTNAHYVWVVTEWAFREKARVANAYYPGDAYVDHIGVDAYNWLGCASGGEGQWRSPSTILAGHRRFGAHHPGKGLMVMEWGTVEDPDRPGRKAQWIRHAAHLFSKPGWQRYRAIVHWDARNLEDKPSPCDFDYRTSPSALNAWRDMGNLPTYDADSSCDIERLAEKLFNSIAVR